MPGERNEPQGLFAITTPKIVDTGKVSYAFVIRSGAPNKACAMAKRYGLVTLEERQEGEIDPFKLARGERSATGPNSAKRWRVFMGTGAAQDLTVSVDEDLDGGDPGLVDLIPDLGDGVLLMERSAYDRFESACNAAGVRLDVHHSDRELATG